MQQNLQSQWQEERKETENTSLRIEPPHRLQLPGRRDELSQTSPRLSQFALVAAANRKITASDVFRYFSSRRTLILLSLCLLQISLFVLLASWVRMRPSWFLDVAITRNLQEFKAPWLRESMIAISVPGNMPLQFLAFVLLTAGIFFFARLRLEAIMLVILFEGSRYLNEFLKALVNRPRPSPTRIMVIGSAGGTSFPSGHVMSYVAFWGFLFLLGLFVLRGKAWLRIPLLIISGLFVILVGPSRIYLGHHWATDTIGSYLMSGALLSLALLLYFIMKKMSPRLKTAGMQGVKKARALLNKQG